MDKDIEFVEEFENIIVLEEYSLAETYERKDTIKKTVVRK